MSFIYQESSNESKPSVTTKLAEPASTVEASPFNVRISVPSLQSVTGAMSAISHTPERGAARYIAGWQSQQESIVAWVIEQASSLDLSDGFKDLIEAELQRWLDGYQKRVSAYVSAMGRTASAFIVGPSNFPVERNRKRCDTERKRMEELLAWSDTGLRRLRKLLTPAEDLPIGTYDADAKDRLEAKAEASKSKADRMVELNKLYRTIRKSHDSAGAAFVELFEQCDENEKKEIMSNVKYSPWCKDRPYPPYAITYARTAERTAARRAVHVERVQAQETLEWQGENAKLVDNIEAGRIQLFFPSKPAYETIQELKRNGFRWTPSIGAWQAYRTYHHTMVKARQLAGIEEAA